MAATASSTRLSHRIGSDWIEGGDYSIPSVNPSRPADVVALIPGDGSQHVDRAFQAAQDAFGSWSRLSGPARAEYLYKWSEAIKARAGELAQAMVREVGKPIGEAKGEVGRCEMILRYFAGEAVRPIGDVIPAQVAGALQYSYREPLGPIAVITPWNFPLAIPLWKCAPALAFGNTVVMKPAETSSLMGAFLAETAEAAGVPAGVFNVLLGSGSKMGPAMVSHPFAKAVSFTGSDNVGSRIAVQCAERNIKCQTEMGGKNVGIVLEDANLTQAANLVAGGAMRFAGQKCTATSRVVVVKHVYGMFMDELRSAIDKLPYGDPMQEATAVGPVISESSHASLTEAIAHADAETAYAAKTESQDGYFVPPTVFGKVKIDSRLAQEELFGPVLAAIEAEDFDDAIRLANQTQFGLSASLFTQNIGKALSYIDRIEAGMVRVNGDTTGVDPHAPFGGLKGSSSHSREQGPAAKEFFTEIKTVQINP